MQADRRTISGALLAVVSATAFGFIPLLAQWAYRDGVSLEMLLFLRFAIAASALGAWIAWRGLPMPRGRTLAGLVALGLLGYVGQSLCYFGALRHAPGGLAALLLYLFPAVVAVLSRVIFRERLGAARAAAIAVALAGTALTAGPLGSAEPRGIVLGVGAALVYALYVLAGSRITPGAGAIQSSAVIIGAAACFYGGVAAWTGAPLPATGAAWASVAGLAVVSTVVAIIAFFASLARIGPVRTSTISTVEPAVAVALGLLMGERFTAVQLAGGALILGAAVTMARAGGGSAAVRVAAAPAGGAEPA